METFYLDENQEEVVFELLADGSVEKIWPYMAVTDLNREDLIKWLQSDIAKGFNSKVISISEQTNDGNPTRIFWEEGQLSWSGDTLATEAQYKLSDRVPMSIFEALNPGENVQLEDGYFILDDELDLTQDWSIV